MSLTRLRCLWSFHLSAYQRQYMHHRCINVCHPVILGKHMFRQRHDNVSGWNDFEKIKAMDNNLTFHINKHLFHFKIFHWYIQFQWNPGRWLSFHVKVRLEMFEYICICLCILDEYCIHVIHVLELYRYRYKFNGYIRAWGALSAIKMGPFSFMIFSLD